MYGGWDWNPPPCDLCSSVKATQHPTWHIHALDNAACLTPPVVLKEKWAFEALAGSASKVLSDSVEPKRVMLGVGDGKFAQSFAGESE